MKQGWEIKKLGEVCDILDSQRKPVTKKDRKEGQYPYYGATGIQDYVDSYIFDGRYLLLGEDGAKWGTMDKSAFIIEGKCWVNNHAHILKVHDCLIDTFAEYYLVFKDLDEYITGAIVRKLTQQALRDIPMLVPPIAEQEKIVAELDCLSGIIEKKKQQLKELDNLAQTIFYEMFGDPVENDKGWDVKKFPECYKLTSGKNLTAKKIVEGDYPVYGGNGIVGYHNDYNLDGENIIIGRVGALCGNVRNVFGKAYITDNAFILSKIENCWVNVFILHLLERHNLRQYARDALQPVVSNTGFKNIDIIIPPISLQQNFASKIEVIEKQKELIAQSIKETETLFNSRMDYYFN